MCLTARFPRFKLAFTNSKKYKSIGIGQNTTKFDRPIPIPGKKADTTDTDTIGASLFTAIQFTITYLPSTQINERVVLWSVPFMLNNVL